MVAMKVCCGELKQPLIFLLIDQLVYSKLCKHLLAPSFRDVRDGPRVLDGVLQGNEFGAFFRNLSATTATGQVEGADKQNHDENDENEGTNIDSEATGSSEENQQEIYSESTLQDFFEVILRHEGRSVSTSWCLEM